MNDFYLDLRDKTAVTDFLAENLSYAKGKEREAAEKLVKAYHDGEYLKTDQLIEAVRKLAIEIYPVRYSLNRFFNDAGIEEEWERLCKSVRPSTAHLLKRFRTVSQVKSLDKVLKHAESEVALHDEERMEIEEVRKHLREDYWRENAESLNILVKDGRAHLDASLNRLGKMRDLAITLTPEMQDEVFSKIARYEDRLLYEGEVIPLEILDGELKYYIEQKEISPLE